MTRNVQAIEHEQGEEQPSVAKTEVVVEQTPAVVVAVSMHYPKPTALSRILKDVAYWSEWSFIVDPSLDRHLQIVSPRKVDVATGMGLFQAALESVGLRMIHLREDVVKISKQRKDICI